MAILGIILGIVVFCLVGAFGNLMLGSAQASVLPALVAGLWVAWACFRHGAEQRAKFLHPVPREYKRPKPVVFQKIRDILADTHVEYGDTWSPRTVDTKAGRIVEDLRYTEEEDKVQAGSQPQIRKERVRRFLRLEAQMKTTDKDTTILQLDWLAKAEGSNPLACDGIITTFSESLDSSLGNGVEITSPAVYSKRLVPPWWLIGITGFVLCGMGLNFLNAFGGDESSRSTTEERAKRLEQNKAHLKYELEEWPKYKQQKGIQ